MLICLHIDIGCFCATMAGLSSCNRDSMTNKSKIFTIWLFTEKVCGHLCEVFGPSALNIVDAQYLLLNEWISEWRTHFIRPLAPTQSTSQAWAQHCLVTFQQDGAEGRAGHAPQPYAHI